MTTPGKGRIFISYRRADSAGYAGRIYDRLTAHFGEDAIFMDVDTIEAGVDFVKVLQNAVQSCDVLVTLIGRRWLNIKDETGERRLDNPEDFVRVEVAAALEREIRVIPVLVDGVTMPSSDELPDNLKPLVRRNALQINHHSFNADVQRLTSQLKLTLKAAKRERQTVPFWFSFSLGLIVVLTVAIFLGVIYLLQKTSKSPSSTGTESQPSEAPAIETSPSDLPAPETFVPTNTAQLQVTPTNTPELLDVGSTMISDKDSMVMVYVPAGEFQMGSEYGDDDEKPAHTVYLDAFWIDQTEVTNAMYAMCVEAEECNSPSDTKSSTRDIYYSNSEFDDYPVIFVSWNDAVAYCTWARRRLPTEKEWEKAAGWDEDNQIKRVYPWGNIFDGTEVNSCDINCPNPNIQENIDDGYGDTAPVGSYPKGVSFYGAYNMSGNVWEWVTDWYDVYPGGDASVSEDFGQTHRVIRGGSWYNNFITEVIHRARGYPFHTSQNVGFRCARDAE